MKIYVSIPMSGLDLATQRAKAAEIAERFKKLGHEPVNPFDTPEAPAEMSERQRYAYYMGEDIKRLIMCDAIFMCDGWEGSVGCAIENSIANIKKMVVFHSLEQVRKIAK